jgi:hypothetical protein
MKFYSAIAAGLIVGGGLTYGIYAGLNAYRYNDCQRQMVAAELTIHQAKAQCEYMLSSR